MGFEILKEIPIFQWLPYYTKSDLVSDLISGLTIGLTIVPQSLAYAALAGLGTEYGLYSSFAGQFVYVIFGTVREISIGPTSIMALLTLAFTKNLSIDYVILLTFLSGLVELMVGIFRFGYLVDLISVPVISGLTSATALIVIVSQTKGILGLDFKSHGIIPDLLNISKHISDFKINDCILGLFCISSLFVLKALGNIQIKKQNPKLAKILWFLSVSRNALIVIFTTLVAYWNHVDDKNTIFVLSGKAKSGLPEFHIPRFSVVTDNKVTSFFEMTQQLGLSMFIIPALAVFTSAAVGRTFASTTMNPSKEMIALGLCNIFGSFFSSMPTCGAFTRSAVANSSGIKSSMAGVFAGSVVLFSLQFLMPYMYYIPKATLSAVLITAVSFMFDFKTMLTLWRFSKRDLLVNLCTFVFTLIYGFELGLLIGTVFNSVLLLKIWIKPKVYVTVKGSAARRFVLAKPKIGYLYPSANYIIEKIITVSKKYEYIPVVIDCSNMLMIDYTTLHCFETLTNIFEKKNRQISFINVSKRNQEKLLRFTNLNHMYICENADIAMDLFFAEKV